MGSENQKTFTSAGGLAKKKEEWETEAAGFTPNLKKKMPLPHSADRLPLNTMH